MIRGGQLFRSGGTGYGPSLKRSRNAFLLPALLALSGLFLSPAAAAEQSWAPFIDGVRGPGDKLYILTSEKGGLFVSDNGGRRWKNLGGSLPSSHFFSLAVSSEGSLFLAAYDELLTSPDGGNSWRSMKGGGRVKQFLPSSGGTCVAVFWDSGIHWTAAENFVMAKAEGEDGTFLVADLEDEGKGHLRAAVFGRGILFSGDGGRTWSLDKPGPANIFPLVLARSSVTGTVFTGTLEGGVFRKEEGGEWQPGGEGLPPLCTVQALAADEQGVLWAGTHKQGLFVSSDDGRTWSSFPVGDEKEMSVTVLVPFKKGVLAGTSAGSLFLADRESFGVIGLLPSDPVVGLAREGGRLLALTRSGGLFASSDGGNRWVRRGSAGSGAVFLAAVPGGDLFAGTDRNILLSRDGGLSWTEIPLPAERAFTSLAWTSAGGFLAGTAGEGLYRSPDGYEWQKVEDVDGEYVFSLQSPDGTVMAAGTDRGFSVSLDGGLTWRNIYVIRGISSLAFDNDGKLWGVSRTGLWNVSLPEGETEEAKIDGFSWSPFEYLTEIFPAEGKGLLAVARERVVRLVPGESPGRFSLRETNLSNTRVLACLPIPGGGTLIGTPAGFFRRAGGEAPWTEVELP
ncbi:MAG: hypothetical protein PWP47_1278 [Synergistaceae bacterium]|jgi:photosystem II stability/assembly factor-like uncharacterized protein|nr:hypothetical protein [Synergistaceae bacterium]